MKFNDLAFDSLEIVLNYLGLIDLLNVADSTRRLRKAAELTFARKYGEKFIRFHKMEISPNESFEVTRNEIEINSLKIGLQLLRCIGPSVFKIEITSSMWYSGANEKLDNTQYQIDRKLCAYINNYCAKYLKELSIDSMSQYDSEYRQNLLGHFHKRFEKLVRFRFDDYNFTENICLKTLFPYIVNLESVHHDDVSFFATNTKYFARLKKLRIWGGNCVKNKMVHDFLKLNPQLKDFWLGSDVTENSSLSMDLIRVAVDSLQNVETLTLNIKPITFIKNRDCLIHMKSVKVFKIRLDQFKKSTIHFLPFSFKQLEKLHITFPKQELHYYFAKQFADFLDAHPKITHLTFSDFSRSAVNWSRLVKSLPSLVCIRLCDCFLSTDQTIEIMAKFPTIKQFCFESRDNYFKIRHRFDEKWQLKLTPFWFRSPEIMVEVNRRI